MRKTFIQQLLMAVVLLVASNYKLNAQNNVELWGALASGGIDNLGTLGHYNLTTSTWTTDYDFTTPFPGSNSKQSQLTEVDGKQYGIIGGGAHGAGLLFEWDPATNVYTKKFDFSPVNGSGPVGSLTYYDGKLYGMTSTGGVYGGGVIFEWNLATNSYTKKIDFDSYNLGASPQGSLTYFDGKLYGMTLQGGAYGSGVIFEWDPATNVYTKKFEFSGTNGTLPYGSLTYGGGNFYGMTRTGGANNVGVLFEWNPFTNVYTKKVDFDSVNGSGPVAALTYDGEKFYGMTAEGGANGWGVLFEWNPLTNTYSKKMDFNTGIGAQPQGSLIYIGGKFYGTTFFGGSALGPGGVLFEWDPSTNVYAKKFNFNDADGNNPFGSLNYSSGKLFGMTYGGGANNYGVIFQWDLVTNVYSKKIDFNTAGNGANPHGALAYVGGKFYGATRTGGTYGYGVLFEWDPQVKVYTKKLDFNKANGANPEGSLTYRDGKFYGLTYRGGISNEGVLFEWDPVTNIYVKKVDFNNAIGSTPNGALTEFDGKFYGITIGGGAGGGVIFEWDPSSNIYKNRMNFMCVDGCHPQNSMTLINDKFYGMTNVGGADNRGVIFVWDPITNVYTKKIDLNLEIGSDPVNPLTYNDGKFYGTTFYGGTYGGGLLFEWDPTTNLYTKRLDIYLAFGAGRVTGPLIYNDGKFYGSSTQLFEWNPTTNEHIKKIDFNAEIGVGAQPFLLVETILEPVVIPTLPATNISFTNVHSASMTVSFTPGNGTHRLAVMKAGDAPSFKPVDNTSYTGGLGNGESVVYNGKGTTFNFTGLIPNTQYFVTIFEYNSDSTSTRYLVSNAPLASTFTKNTSSLPTLFGMASAGGLSGVGTIFKINVDGSGLGVLHNFNGTNGANPTGSLIQATDGSLWGTTSNGGSSDLGTIFKINADGSGFQVLHNFNNTDGANPNNSLIQATDGSLLGMTSAGGSSGNGTIFKINLDGKGYRVMHNFNGLNGAYPSGSLIQALDGYFYGMTPYGGTWGAGTVFRMDTNGGYVILQHMRGPGEDVWVGANPNGSLIQARDGYLYGMSTNGGLWGCGGGYVGAIFRIYTDGGYEELYNFDNCNEKGAYPYGSLVQTSDGWMYGMANRPLVDGEKGTIFKIKEGDTDITALHKFNQLNGFNSEGNLIAYNGKLFGFTPDGGQYNSGVIFGYDLASSTYQELGHLNDTTGIRPRFGSLLIVNDFESLPNVYVTSPVNGANGQNVRLNLTSKSVTGASIYTMQISSDEAFLNAKIRSGSSTLLFDSLAYNTTYFARVKTDLREEFGWVTSFSTAAPEFFSYVTSPANGADHMPLSLIITSNLVWMADTYTIELNSDPNFGEATAIVKTGGSSISFNNLALSTTYYTRVKTNLSPNWGEMRVFTTDDALSLSYIISPGNNASNVSWLPLVRVNTIPEATFYRIQLCASDDFTSSQVFEKSMPSPSINFSDLQFNTRYYARATTDLTPQGWGPTRFFTTGNPVSFAYVESPLNNFTGANTTLNIASRSVPSAGSYTIQLSESSDFASVAFEVTGPTRMLPFSGLKYNTTYFSRVQTDLTKEFGQVKSFTTRKAETLAFVTAPSNHAVNVNNVSIYITSNFVPGAQAYSIQLSETSDFSKVAFEVTGSNRTLLFGGLKFSATYFSRVRTDLAPEFGELKSFTTRTAESIAYVVSPSHNSEYINTRLNIYSNYVLGASQYTIQLSESSDFAQVAFEVSGSTRMLSFSGLKYNTTYFSQVNTDLTTEFGQVRSFSTCSAESLAYVTTPSNHAVDVNNNSIFITSNSVPGAQAYTIQLSETSDFSTVAFERTGFNRTLLFGGLKYSTTYYSRVSTDLELEFGEQKSFTTRTAESIAYIVSPENNSVNVGTSLYIYSNSIPGSTEYTIQLSQRPDFSIVDFEVKGHTRALAFMGLIEGTIYYNRVRSNLSANFGQVRSFKTRGVAPSARIASNVIKLDEKSAEVNEFVVSVYPNPFREKLILFIESPDQQAEILLMDLNGRNIHQSIEKTNRIIELEKEFSPGAYLLSIKTDHYSKIIRVVRVE